MKLNKNRNFAHQIQKITALLKSLVNSHISNVIRIINRSKRISFAITLFSNVTDAACGNAKPLFYGRRAA